MSNWGTIAEADVLTRLTGPEVTSYKTLSLGVGQSNPLPEITAHAVNEVRGYIASSGSYALNTGATVPNRLKDATLALIRYRLITRLPIASGSVLIEMRRREFEDAIRLLERVGDGRFQVDEPDETDTDAEARGEYGVDNVPYPDMMTDAEDE